MALAVAGIAVAIHGWRVAHLGGTPRRFAVWAVLYGVYVPVMAMRLATGG